MYVKATNGVVEKYPYTIGQLRKDNPNVSFPRVLSAEVLADWGVYSVTPQNPPDFNYATQNCSAVNPTLQNNVWVQTWSVTEATEEEKQQRTVEKSNEVRSHRDSLLAETDWRFRSDMNPSQAWIEYCQALRDVPQQAGFPWNVQWPSKPE